VLEDGVTIGFGASVLGGVVIGKNATVGAGAWCFEDVPENGVAIGMPAKLHRVKTVEEITQGDAL
jgi:serine O-acetyltransferase